jgi:hypothetical protein
MTTHISSDTQAAREQSRDPSGRFGTQPATESDATLSTVAPLSDAQTDLLDAIKNAPYSDPEDDAERIENMLSLRYGGVDEFADAVWVADRLRDTRAPDLALDFDYSPGSLEVTGYNVGVSLGDGTQWTTYRDTNELSTDPSAEGQAAAAGYAESIMGDYEQMRTRAIRTGLLRPDVVEADLDGPSWSSCAAQDLNVGDTFSLDGESHQVVSVDGDNKETSVENGDGEVFSVPNDRTVLRYQPGRDEVYRCRGCGRPEESCSADPCAGVVADREAGT